MAACQSESTIEDAPAVSASVVPTFKAGARTLARKVGVTTHPFVSPSYPSPRVPISAGKEVLGLDNSVTSREQKSRRSAFDREIGEREFDRRSGVPNQFSVLPGINVPTKDIFKRYAETFRLRPGVDDFLPVTEARPDYIVAGQETRVYRQFFKGVPVDGASFFVHEEHGMFRSAVGHAAPDIQVTIQPAISEYQAINLALKRVQPGAPGSPKAELAISFVGLQARDANLRLIWRIRFHEIPEAEYVDLDAATGQVLYVETRIRE